MSTFVDSFTANELRSAIIRNPLVVDAETLVMDAIDQMIEIRNLGEVEESRSSCVLVVERGEILGILTESDVVRLTIQSRSLETLTMQAVMTSPVIAIQESELTDFFSVMQLFQQHRIRHLPILDDRDRFLGMITHESLWNLSAAQRYELEIKKSEQRFLSLITVAPVGIYRTDDLGYCLYVNDLWCQIAGLTPAEAKGFGWIDGIHPSDRELVSQEWNASILENRPFKLEYRFLNKTGGIAWAYGQAVAEYDDFGEIIGYIGTITDISDRKAAEQSLKVQRDFNQLIAEISSRFVDVSPDHLDIEINRALELIGEATNSDTSYLIKFSIDDQTESQLPNGTVSMTHEWAKPKYPRQIALVQNIPLSVFPMTNAKLLQREIVNVPRVTDAPIDAAIDRASWQRFNIVSFLSVPLIQRSIVTGTIGFASYSDTVIGDGEIIRLLQVMAQTIANAQQRVQDEQNLQESEERLRLALRAANQGLYDLNLQTGEAIVGLEYATMLGYNPATFQETNAKWIARLHPDDREHVAKVYQDYVAGILPEYKVEFRQLTQMGEWKWILSLGKIVSWDEEGNPLRMMGTHTDISDRKQSEEMLQQLNQDLERKVEERTAALQASEATNRATLEAIPDLLMRLKRDGTCITYIKPGIDSENFLPIENHISEVLPAELLQNQLQIIEKAIATRELQVYEHHFLKQGRTIYEEVRILAINEDEVLAIVRDISDRKQYEEQLLKSDAHLKTAQRIAKLGSWEFDPNSQQIICSEEIFQIFGRDPTSGTLTFDEIQQQIYPEDREHRLQMVQTAIETLQPYDREFRFYRGDGTLGYMQTRGEPIADDSGHLILLVGTIQDITDRKQAEAKLMQITSQLTASNRELEAFAYSVSHDLRSPLRAIDGFSKALLEDYGDKFDEDGKDYFDRIRRNVSRMGMLIEDLLRLSRVSRSEMQYSKVNLSLLVQEQCEELQTIDPEREVKILIDPNVIVSADKTLMRVVISNLIQNAWKFTSNHATARIEFGVIPPKEKPDEFIYFVRDDGAGFDMNHANMLFGVFQRLHNTNEFAGTGIGLATVQRAIHRHGGKVWAEGAIEQGMTIYFTLPDSLIPGV